MSDKTKKVADTAIESTYLVLPEHTNAMGNIFGGTIMSWIDIQAAIVAYRHCRSSVVTASIDELNFSSPVHLGELVTLKSSVNFTSQHSIEIGVKVLAENPIIGVSRQTSDAYLTFVSLDENGKAQPVPQVTPVTDIEIKRFNEGQLRYEARKARR